MDFGVPQYFNKRIGGLQVTIERAIFGRRLPVRAFQLLRDAPADMNDIRIDIRPFERVDLPFSHAGIVCDGKELIISPARDGAGLLGVIAAETLLGGHMKT